MKSVALDAARRRALGVFDGVRQQEVARAERARLVGREVERLAPEADRTRPPLLELDRELVGARRRTEFEPVGPEFDVLVGVESSGRRMLTTPLCPDLTVLIEEEDAAPQIGPRTLGDGHAVADDHVGAPLLPSERGRDEREADALGRCVVEPLRHPVHQAAGARDLVLAGGRAPELVVAVPEGVLEEEGEVAVAPAVVAAEVLRDDVVAEPRDLGLGQPVAHHDLALRGLPPAAAGLRVGEEEVGESEAGVVLQSPLVLRREQARVAPLPEVCDECGGVGLERFHVVIGEQVGDGLEHAALRVGHRGERLGKGRVGGCDAAGTEEAEAEVESGVGIDGAGGGHLPGGGEEAGVVPGGGMGAEREAVRRGAGGFGGEGRAEVVVRAAEGAVRGPAHPPGRRRVPTAAALGEAAPPVEFEEIAEGALLVGDGALRVEGEDLAGERGAAAVGHAEGPLLAELALVEPEAGFEKAHVVRLGGEGALDVAAGEAVVALGAVGVDEGEEVVGLGVPAVAGDDVGEDGGRFVEVAVLVGHRRLREGLGRRPPLRLREGSRAEEKGQDREGAAHAVGRGTGLRYDPRSRRRMQAAPSERSKRGPEVHAAVPQPWAACPVS